MEYHLSDSNGSNPFDLANSSRNSLLSSGSMIIHHLGVKVTNKMAPKNEMNDHL
jgi:hypothetical protein